MKLINREKTIEFIASDAVDSMDFDDMYQCVYEMELKYLESMTDIDIIEQLDIQCIDEKDHVV